jgi:tetratricopeptide (TPR) repeat protein
MRYAGMTTSLICVSFICFSAIKAQDDETRQASGLPIMIGRNSTNRSNTVLSGRITISGRDSSKPMPSFSVAVYANGALIDKRSVMESGTYYIPSVPREGAILAVELSGMEIARYSISSSIMGSVRYDVNLTSIEVERAEGKTGVISAKNLYSRSDQNQKLFDKASSAFREKKLDTAIVLYKQLLEKDSKDFIAWTEVGTLYFRNQKLLEAEEAYTKAIEQNPDFAVALVNLGKLYLELKEPEKAINILLKAVETEPNSADAQHYLGESYLQIKKGSKAVVYLNEAIKLAPIEKAEIHLRLAQLYNAANLKDKAIDEYKLFLSKVPDYKEKEKIQKYIIQNSPK